MDLVKTKIFIINTCLKFIQKFEKLFIFSSFFSPSPLNITILIIY